MDTDMTALDDRDLRLLGWYGDLVVQAEQQLASGLAPDWLKARIDQGEVRRAVEEAGLQRAAVLPAAAIALALFAALKGLKPRANAEVRKDLKRLINRARGWRHALAVDQVMADTTAAAWCDFFSSTLPDGSTQLSWTDPIAELRTALDLSIERMSQAHLPAHQGGTRPSVTTLAAIGLVGLAIEHQRDISAAPLARLAARLLDPVIGEYEARYTDQVGAPDWHDRISADLADRRAPKSAPAEK